MNTFITSDLHFGHTNILKFCSQSRPFKDVAEMDKVIIENWNRRIQQYDIVYILGDISFAKLDSTVGILNRLNGLKVLIEGNHDQKLLKEQSFKDCFEEIHVRLNMNYNKTKIVMDHFPIAEWDGMHRGSVHFHGHLHGNLLPNGVTGRIFDVGIDSSPDFAPYELNRLIEKVIKQPIRTHH